MISVAIDFVSLSRAICSFDSPSPDFLVRLVGYFALSVGCMKYSLSSPHPTPHALWPSFFLISRLHFPSRNESDIVRDDEW